MSVSLRGSGALAVVVLALGMQAHAQAPGNPNAGLLRPQIIPFPVNPNQYVAPNQTARQLAYNVAVLGRGLSQVPPYAMGYNPYPQVVGSIAPVTPAYDPYSLSTVGGYNPYLSTSAGLASSPYSLSTAPSGGSSFMSPYGGFPFMPGYGWGIGELGAGPGIGYGATLQGMASLTSATGQYWKDIQSARITREQSRQAALETARRRIQFEMWYETVRPTAPKMLDQERATDIDRARKDPSDPEVLSGRTLNILLKSSQAAGSLNRGPNIELNEETLRHINVTGGTSAGNVGMLKGGVNLTWPEVLQETRFEASSKRLTRNLRQAVDTLKDREPIPSNLLKDIRGDFKTINDGLTESADELSPAQYIEARRFLNQLQSSIKALSDPSAAKYFNNTWNARGKNVAELVEHMTREGLTFAPAAQGDEPAYRALYQALRAFESGLNVAQR